MLMRTVNLKSIGQNISVDSIRKKLTVSSSRSCRFADA